MEHSFSDHGETEAVLKVEETMLEIARIMGISVESRLVELRNFIEEMVKEERVKIRLGIKVGRI